VLPVIELLGPLRVTVGGRPVAVTAGRPRILRATSPGRPVSTDRLAAALWGEQQPDNPRRSLHTYVTRLRTALGADAIGTRSDGYLLEVPADAVDLSRFTRLLEAAGGRARPRAGARC
jgi:DNA-binding SARP family transcriptional activator